MWMICRSFEENALWLLCLLYVEAAASKTALQTSGSSIVTVIFFSGLNVPEFQSFFCKPINFFIHKSLFVCFCNLKVKIFDNKLKFSTANPKNWRRRDNLRLYGAMLKLFCMKLRQEKEDEAVTGCYDQHFHPQQNCIWLVKIYILPTIIFVTIVDVIFRSWTENVNQWCFSILLISMVNFLRYISKDYMIMKSMASLRLGKKWNWYMILAENLMMYF